ncbi:uncharacterized protein LOC115631667 isoform X2 [Scaptodrosophila lebanonensis]|uniref:Uncharacterized protein LOC115621192 isoform X2 n=1 Tax=Drosophila lebanonensis TaxID=7225 RepID=A0A6J2TRM1_DROLE|nr:uncharacterized protein LOC115621192 isoform X2 [Scaptodrosophila lebanonensis]XP_030378160.1 uncharacterized protein LOC115626819 isoform X2 [Scaptodrosophila lebanonensis]XP_030382324.1 uncharacterized protein LOC115629869 [Scaptodrosophila lebanonensis]XP_030384340.1 uncharacterized protein LOC115631667 isoform X2 [Scaptodrosophila lebanonensis]
MNTSQVCRYAIANGQIGSILLIRALYVFLVELTGAVSAVYEWGPWIRDGKRDADSVFGSRRTDRQKKPIWRVQRQEQAGANGWLAQNEDEYGWRCLKSIRLEGPCKSRGASGIKCPNSSTRTKWRDFQVSKCSSAPLWSLTSVWEREGADVSRAVLADVASECC